MDRAGERHGPRGARWRTAGGAVLVAIALVVALAMLHAGDLERPLLEGAAGKQTHTAMVARNLLRGSCDWWRPTVDDIGPPGYFVKELPAYPLAVAGLYRLTGSGSEALGRVLSLVAWASGGLLLFLWFCPSLPAWQTGTAVAWFVLAPMALAYSGAFMNDPSVVALSLGTVLAADRWRRNPSAGRAATLGALLGATALLKLHAVFWVVPACCVQLVSASVQRPSRGRWTELLGAVTAGSALAVLWYLHAASVHRDHPVPGATTTQGWVDLALLAEPRLYRIIAGQIGAMIFTLPGAALAVVGILLRPRGWRRTERAALAWGAGVIVQSLVFGTRMFDEVARGTEYYQLPLVVPAGMLVGRGVAALGALLPGAPRFLRPATLGGLVAVCGLAALRAAAPVVAIPPPYQRLLDDCAVIRRLTPADARVMVLADRGGTALYYCDRRGWTFTPARPSDVHRVPTALTGVRANEFGRALATVDYIYLPFPEILEGLDQLAAHLARDWRPVPGAPDGLKLLRRNPVSDP